MAKRTFCPKMSSENFTQMKQLVRNHVSLLTSLMFGGLAHMLQQCLFLTLCVCVLSFPISHCTVMLSAQISKFWQEVSAHASVKYVPKRSIAQHFEHVWCWYRSTRSEYSPVALGAPPPQTSTLTTTIYIHIIIIPYLQYIVTWVGCQFHWNPPPTFQPENPTLTQDT